MCSGASLRIVPGILIRLSPAFAHIRSRRATNPKPSGSSPAARPAIANRGAVAAAEVDRAFVRRTRRWFRSRRCLSIDRPAKTTPGGGVKFQLMSEQGVAEHDVLAQTFDIERWAGVFVMVLIDRRSQSAIRG